MILNIKNFYIRKTPEPLRKNIFKDISGSKEIISEMGKLLDLINKGKAKISELMNKFDKEILSEYESTEINNLLTNNGYFVFLNFEVKTMIDKNIRDLSQGEKKEFTLYDFFNSEKDNLLIDEIDSSLDSSFISNKLSKIMNNLRGKKTIFFATHNANLAINTIPINWILRDQSINGKSKKEYKTFYGNLYDDVLWEIKNEDNKLVLSEQAVEILEGGKESFKRRNKIWRILN